MTLAGPIISGLFAVMFFYTWIRWKEFRYLPWLATAFALFSLSVLSQILMAPSDIGLNTLISSALYIATALVFAKACLMRLGLKLNFLLNAAISVLIFSSVAYFYYVDRDIQMRIYCLNFGLGLLLLAVAWKMAWVVKKSIDRILVGLLLAFSIHFFPRTFLSLRHMGVQHDANTFAHTEFWLWLNFTFEVSTVLLGLVLLATVATDMLDTLHQKAITDPLTSLMNRRGFEESAKRKFSNNSTKSLCLVLCDIDDFKSINDLYGHQGGDSVLKVIAALLKKSVRASDVIARLGGEEFILLLSEIDRIDTYVLMERLREAVASTQFGSGVLRRRKVTMSFGVVELNQGETLDAATRRADEMLYMAKRNGKNRICVSWSADEARNDMSELLTGRF